VGTLGQAKYGEVPVRLENMNGGLSGTAWEDHAREIID